MTLTVLAQSRRSAPLLVLAAITVAWSLAILAALTGTGTAKALHHHELLHELDQGGPSLWAALGLFLVTWQAHVAAMMLPSSLPLIALFDRVAAQQPRARVVRLVFLGGYAAVWTAFGALALAGDVIVHRIVHDDPWLAGRPWPLGGAVLALAGLFQFSRLKDHCLQQCRHPSGFIVRYYRRGQRAAFALGVRHGLFCLGAAGPSCSCCFPLASPTSRGWHRSRC